MCSGGTGLVDHQVCRSTHSLRIRFDISKAAALGGGPRHIRIGVRTRRADSNWPLLRWWAAGEARPPAGVRASVWRSDSAGALSSCAD